ncbi:MAG: glycosyltransferase family 2 protein [Thermoproteota archaeon]
MQIDVVMITKNSDRILRKCLKSIYDNIPVHNLIVVDAYSEDQTLDILQEFPDVKLFFDDGTRATARQKGISEVSTSWFAFVDSDVILCNNWFGRAKKYLNSNVGAIWGQEVELVGNIKSPLFYKILLKVSKECFKIRGGLHDTLIRNSAVQDIDIPSNLVRYEDKYIIDYIAEKEYHILTPEKLFCLHLRPESDWNIKESMQLAVEEIKNGLIDSKAFSYVRYYPFWVIFWALQWMGKFE